jgi:FtsP/CotA-like multicopper oxidase with cupredoxin domain
MSRSRTTLRLWTKRYFSLFAQRGVDEFVLTLLQGTFWYHSHFDNQYCDGLRGAFIIEDPDDPHIKLYDVDNGKTLVSYDYRSHN